MNLTSLSYPQALRIALNNGLSTFTWFDVEITVVPKYHELIASQRGSK